MNEKDFVPETEMSVANARDLLDSHTSGARGQGGPSDCDVKLAKATLALAELRRGPEAASPVSHGEIPARSFVIEGGSQPFAVHLARLANSISAGDLVHLSGGLIISPLGDDRVVVEGGAILKRRGSA